MLMIRKRMYLHTPGLEVAHRQQLVEWLEGVIWGHLLSGPSHALQRVEDGLRGFPERLRSHVHDVLVRISLGMKSVYNPALELAHDLRSWRQSDWSTCLQRLPWR